MSKNEASHEAAASKQAAAKRISDMLKPGAKKTRDGRFTKKDKSVSKAKRKMIKQSKRRNRK
jgi:hypothetical protein